MIKIKINNKSIVLNSLYDIFKYDYLNITLLEITHYEFTELPKNLTNLEKLIIKDCNRVNFTIPNTYIKLKELYLENIYYRYLYVLPKFESLKKLTIKFCNGFIIPNYDNLEYLIIDKYIIYLNQDYYFIKTFPNLKFCKIKDFICSYIYIDCPKIKCLEYTGDYDIPFQLRKYNNLNYYSFIDINFINNYLCDIKLNSSLFIKNFVKYFNEFIYYNINYGKFNIDYMNYFFNTFIDYNKYPKDDLTNEIKTVIFNCINDLIINRRFNEFINYNNQQIYAYAYFINAYSNILLNYENIYIKKKRDEIYNFAYEPYTKLSFSNNIINKINDFIKNFVNTSSQEQIITPNNQSQTQTQNQNNQIIIPNIQTQTQTQIQNNQIIIPNIQTQTQTQTQIQNNQSQINKSIKQKQTKEPIKEQTKEQNKNKEQILVKIEQPSNLFYSYQNNLLTNQNKDKLPQISFNSTNNISSNISPISSNSTISSCTSLNTTDTSNITKSITTNSRISNNTINNKLKNKRKSKLKFKKEERRLYKYNIKKEKLK